MAQRRHCHGLLLGEGVRGPAIGGRLRLAQVRDGGLSFVAVQILRRTTCSSGVRQVGRGGARLHELRTSTLWSLELVAVHRGVHALSRHLFGFLRS